MHIYFKTGNELIFEKTLFFFLKKKKYCKDCRVHLRGHLSLGLSSLIFLAQLYQHNQMLGRNQIRLLDV